MRKSGYRFFARNPRQQKKPRARALSSSLIAGNEIQCRAVHAIALARWLWTIVKNMTKMAAAARAMNFRARHHQGAVGLCFNRPVERRPETGPAAAAFIFR